jgi:hypothetical protein
MCTSMKPARQLHIRGTNLDWRLKSARSFSLSMTNMITTCNTTCRRKGCTPYCQFEYPYRIRNGDRYSGSTTCTHKIHTAEKRGTEEESTNHTGSIRGYILFLQDSLLHCLRLPASVGTAFAPHAPQNFAVLCHSSSARACSESRNQIEHVLQVVGEKQRR